MPDPLPDDHLAELLALCRRAREAAALVDASPGDTRWHALVVYRRAVECRDRELLRVAPDLLREVVEGRRREAELREIEAGLMESTRREVALQYLKSVAADLERRQSSG